MATDVSICGPHSALVQTIPHSWGIASWPTWVWPGESRSARWILRAYRDELMRYGALSRTGKTLVVIGKGYTAWLEQRAAHVPGFVSNNTRMRADGPHSQANWVASSRSAGAASGSWPAAHVVYPSPMRSRSVTRRTKPGAL